MNIYAAGSDLEREREQTKLSTKLILPKASANYILVGLTPPPPRNSGGDGELEIRNFRPPPSPVRATERGEGDFPPGPKEEEEKTGIEPGGKRE